MPSNALTRFMMRMMIKQHRRSGDRFQGMDLLYLTTVGARSGEKRQVPVSRYAEPDGSWLVVASSGGSAGNPGWYHNIAANPDSVWAEVSGTTHRVRVEQLEGEPRERAWAEIVSRAPRYDGYRSKTDRQIPVLRLTPVP
jgi:deazaflavin-dependent oxidoreductase (nitroreductase family)